MDAFIGSFPSFTSSSDKTTSQKREMRQLPHLRIPPLRDPLPLQSWKPPSPLEPNAGAIRASKYSSKSALATSSQPPELPPTVAGFLNSTTHTEKPTSVDSISNLDNPPRTVLPAFINLRAVEKLPYSFDEEALPRKRRRVERHADRFGDHLQLPIPKNQKEKPKQPPPFGPLTILNGLNEPPPNAALFPPIEPNESPNILTCALQGPPIISKGPSSHNKGEMQSRQFVEVDGKAGPDKENTTDGSSSLQTPASAAEAQAETQHSSERPDKEEGNQKDKIGTSQKSQPRKKARKWTDEETHDLLRGVVRCGVGNWTSILAQPDLAFNDRTAANLKDRFRVCCSWAYEPDGKSQGLMDSVNNLRSGKIFLPDPRKTKGITEQNSLPSSATTLQSLAANMPHVASTSLATSTFPPGAKNPSTPEKSQTPQKPRRKISPITRGSEALSKKSKSTLVALGLSDPDATVKANKRSRRPFTRAEDEALLKGYAVHGFQWTLIRQDKHLNLMHRKATDLRDRFRTKFPSAYREGGSATAKNISIPASNAAAVNTGSDAAGEGKQLSTLAAPTTSSAAQERFQPSHPVSTIEDPQYRKGAFRRTSNSGSSINITAGDQNAKTNPSSTPTNNVFIASTTVGAAPIDPAMLPPAPPLSSAFAFTAMDESTGPGNGEPALSRWNDVTLPPLVWEELS
ncbi:hypothetical protein MauCBS54593_000151 [Microsporum audouinii]